MAADNGGWMGNGIAGRSLKLHPVTINGQKWIFGCFGSSSFSVDAIAYLEGNGERPIPLEHDPDMAQAGIVWALAANVEGECFRVQINFHFDPILDPFACGGAGREVALGALAAGATAIKAIHIAEQYTDFAKFGCTRHALQ
jgi:hypothetical protein